MWVAPEQKTGIGTLFTEFFSGNDAIFGLISRVEDDERHAHLRGQGQLPVGRELDAVDGCCAQLNRGDHPIADRADDSSSYEPGK